MYVIWSTCGHLKLVYSADSTKGPTKCKLVKALVTANPFSVYALNGWLQAQTG
jgi:hypothetical protein